jgi:hypothetical protein
MSRHATLLGFLVTLFLGFVPSAHARSTVLFDQGHGQRFVIERGQDLDLSRLAGLLRERGTTVATVTAPISARLLDGVDALVISGAFQPYTPQEIEAVAAFVDRGGALCIMLHIAPPLAPLLHRLGVEHANGVIHEHEQVIEANPLNFRVTRLAAHPLFKGLHQFSLYGVWALLDNRPGVQAIARTSPASWIDLNRNDRLDPGDARQSFAVVVAGTSGKGRFVVFGDDAIFQNRFLVGDNLVLGRNLAEWLAAGPVRPSRHSPAR